MNEPIEHTYFRWLCAKIIHVDVPAPSNTYWFLLNQLYSTEYIWLVSGDDNRAEDGVELRRYFAIETGLSSNLLGPLGCSVLEMLIAFAYRAEFSSELSYKEWFWIFIDNLGLSEFNDSVDAVTASFDIANILATFVWRTYSYTGEGSLFPDPDTERDLRQVEVWYQFCFYVADKVL